MEKHTPVLVLNSGNEADTLELQYIADDNIPENLNGESGFHVFHVRALTELILRYLAESESEYALDEEKINAISIAASLHDIGKSRIPKSILDSPAKLSSVEYDIVKKHSVFGEEIIDAIDTDIDPQIITYAKEVARSHHERFDGTGYPDGLSGNDIPISAQVVSLADVFDALTSVRSYKKAFPQDVAIEMITNGMSGVFNPAIVDALIHIVNNKTLVTIREQIQKKRSTVISQNTYTPDRILFIGNTGYITKEFIENSFPDSRITIIGESELKNSTSIKVRKPNISSIRSMLETYDFDLAVYLSNSLTFDSDSHDDAEELRNFLDSIRCTQKDMRILYLTSLDSAFEGNSDKGILARSKESLCAYFSDHYDLDIKTVRIPYLYLGTNKSDFLYRIFEQLHSNKKKITLPHKWASKCYFLSLTDLAELLVRLVDNWHPGSGILTVNDEFNIIFSDLSKKLRECDSRVNIEFTGEHPSPTLKTNNRAIQAEYGWFSKISILEDLENEYENFQALKAKKLYSFADKIKDWLERHSLIGKLLELFALFILTEFLIYLTNSALFFSIVDFRMAFIVIMGTVHGLQWGIAAAGLSSLSWLFAKIASGTKWLTIFYEPTNWLAFVFFFLIGALCGYIRLKSNDKISELTEQSKLLEEKLLFTKELYNDTFNEKRLLKKQIISSKDSFGKIFDIAKQLDTVEPRRLYLKIMDTFEDILENKSISVYSVNENSVFGRLEVASRDIMNDVARSVSLDTFSAVIKTLEKNEVWKNTDLSPGLPMYASGVIRSGKLELLIFVWHAAPDQRSLYYMNLFKILCDLVQMSLLRAYDYNQAVYEQQYIEGTRILNKESFHKVYDSLKQMSDRKVFSYVPIEIGVKGHTLSECYEMLCRKIRTNDILGITEDGSLRLLLSQATKNDLGFILPRFEDLDLEITVLDR